MSIMSTDASEYVYEAVTHFVNDTLRKDVYKYVSDNNDYFIDQIMLRLNYLKSEYKKSYNAEDYEKAHKIREQIAAIMPGFMVMEEFG